MSFFEDLWDSVPVFMTGLSLTVQLTVWTIVLAVVIGGILAAMRRSRVGFLRWIASGYLAIIRGTPLIAQLFVVYFGIVAIVKVPAFTAAVVGLSVHNAAYVAEIFRSGLNSVPTGQVEAARSLGMSRQLAMRKIVGPQAFKVVIPALANQSILALKETAVAAFITVEELFQQAQRLAAATFQPLTFYVIVSIYYFSIIWIMTQLAGWLERRMQAEA
jgi:His/Glu/Gln/Arg/opine family amino acid ABC transporter permease subunit